MKRIGLLLLLVVLYYSFQHRFSVYAQDGWPREVNGHLIKPDIVLNHLNFEGANLRNADLSKADLSHSNFNNADLTVSVYSMNGQQVFNEQVNVSGSKVLDVDFSNLANGNYLIKVDDGEGIATQKLNLLK